jgi:hypothetical protein
MDMSSNSDSALDSDALLRKLRQQMKQQAHFLADDVRQVIRDAEEPSEKEKIARELLQKYLNDPPIKGSIGFDF